MDEVLRQLQQNIEMVCALRSHPSHQLRVISEHSAVVPIITHESRTFPAVMRYFSSDDRVRVYGAILRTLELVKDLGKNKFSDFEDFACGLRAMATTYENDMAMQARIKVLIGMWESLYVKGVNE